MTSGGFRFERFTLDPGDRRLRRDGAPVELNARYLDALALLVREHGRLVSKDRFLSEVWHGVPVTDEALTQCIKTLRRQLGDSAASPRFIETVPKHGYRFIAAVQVEEVHDGLTAGAGAGGVWRRFFLIGGAATIGGGVAGLFGGLFYGLAGALPALPGMGAMSVLLVLLCINVALALTGGAGVGFGIAAAGLIRPGARAWSMVGGAIGGLAVGAAVKLLGVDAFTLLFGRSPGDITGAVEGALLGGAAGLAYWLGSARPAGRIAIAGAIGSAAGFGIALLGGRLMGGSLALLAGRYPGSNLRIDRVGALFGEDGFGPVSRIVTGSVEGALFAACIVGAIDLVVRRWGGGGRAEPSPLAPPAARTGEGGS